MRPILARLACAFALLAAACAARAEPNVPTVLEPWRAWVLKGQEFRACPLIAGHGAGNAADFLCAWPGVLSVSASADGADLAQHWRVDADAWVPLPGDAEHWPQQVTLDGQPATVIDRNGPALWLAAGHHELRARIPWHERPQTLRVPQSAGLVALNVDGKRIAPVQRDGDELALGRAGNAAPDADSLDLRVHRRLADGVPAQLTTVIELHASGQAREETIGPTLPAGFTPIALDGEWPARLDADGRLHVRVQPGSDTLTLEARADAPLAQVIARVAPAPWPQQEIWSYAADPRLRVTAASGAVQVDPAQVGVPDDWRELPAFALGDGAKLVIEERSRGLAGDDGNRLTLDREMWLDFDGEGWFAHDRVQGEMRRGWRFDAAAPYALERAQAGAGDGSALLVTRGASDALGGVEWRTPLVDLDAGLRIARGATLPIAGWQDSFDRIDTVLHLPNGYRLLGAPGADRASGSWMSGWTLLDVFLAAVLALLAWRAFGRFGGLAAIAYLLLGYQESGVPLWTLLAVCALALVVRALPTGRLATGAEWVRRAALAALVLFALPFVADQLRWALHPQLEEHRAIATVNFNAPSGAGAIVAREAMPAAPPAPAAPPPPAPAVESQTLDSVVTGSRVRKADVETASPVVTLDRAKIDHYAESTVMQTGMGEPHWQIGHRYELSWSGPVLPTQTVRLVVAPPWLVRPLRVVLVALLACLIALALKPAARKARPRGATAALFLALGFSALSPPPAQAQSFPSENLLNELRSRLTEAPKCAPACVAIAGADVSARGDDVLVALDVQAAERVAVPLPADEKALTLRSLRVDGVAQDAIARSGAALWTALPRGVHRVELAFEASGDKLALVFPLRPMRTRFSGDGWEASGLADDRLQTETLGLARARTSADATPHDGAQRFAPFVRVVRTLELGIEWSTRTTVERIAPKDGGFTVAVPVLAGEHVASAGFKVDNGRVAAALADGQPSVDWTSTLDKGETLSLVAPPIDTRAEVWQVGVGPGWHVDFSGVPAVAPEDAEANEPRVFEFHPLPGETLTLRIARPAAVQGATRAIDAVQLDHEIGQRAATSTLALTLRASQGGEHAIALPAGAEVLSVSRDGAALNLRPQDGKLSLPLLPGSHRFEIRFRSDTPLGVAAATPAVALGLPAANIDLAMTLPQDRWLLATGGPATGPAVLYWSELAVMLLVAFALSRLPHSPLRLWQWALLGIGFSTYSWIALLVVVGWLFALDWRARGRMPGAASPFNLVQIGVAVLTFVALLCLFDSIRHGLLGAPDMHVVGNGSGEQHLRWFADRSADALPVAHAISLPLWSYELAMLAWSLWLASALVRWLRDGFAAWTRGGYWRNEPKVVVDLPQEDAPAPPQ